MRRIRSASGTSRSGFDGVHRDLAGRRGQRGADEPARQPHDLGRLVDLGAARRDTRTRASADSTFMP